jgi:hypothetical protein
MADYTNRHGTNLLGNNFLISPIQLASAGVNSPHSCVAGHAQQIDRKEKPAQNLS